MNEESLKKFREIVKLINTNVEKAQIHAINLTEEALEKYPEDKDLYIFLQAQANINLAKPQRALKLYKKVNFSAQSITFFGNNFINNAIANYARVFYDSGNFKKAYKIIEPIEDYLDKTDDIFALHTSIRIYFENEEFEKMKAMCQKVINLEINIFPDGWHLSKKIARRLFSSMTFLVFFHYHKGNVKEAANLLQEILLKLELNESDRDSVGALEAFLISRIKPNLTKKESDFLIGIKKLI